MKHPTYDEIIKAINDNIEYETCLICENFWCSECLIDKIEYKKDKYRCVNMSTEEKLLGFAFLLTMPKDIRKSLEETA